MYQNIIKNNITTQKQKYIHIKYNQTIKLTHHIKQSIYNKQLAYNKMLTLQQLNLSSLPPINNNNNTNNSNDNKSQSKSTITYNNPKISVLAAVNKLKQTENKIIEKSNKQTVRMRIIEAAKAREQQRIKVSAAKQSIRKSIQMDKTMRYKSQQQKIKNQSNLHQLATSLRQTRQQFKQSLHQSFRQQSTQIYTSALQQRLTNQQVIKEFKQRQMLLKQQRRLKMAQKLQKSRQKVREFRQSRIGFIKQQRQLDVGELQKKIMARSRYLQRLNVVNNKGSVMGVQDRRRSQSVMSNNNNSNFMLTQHNNKSGDNCEQQQQLMMLTK